MIQVIFNVRKGESKLILERRVEKETLREAMDYIRGYSSETEPLVGKMILQEKKEAA